MPKFLVVALREYRAAVQTRAFLISVALVPVLLLLTASIQRLTQAADVGKPKTFAVVDRSGQLRDPLRAAVVRHNTVDAFQNGSREQADYELTFIEPAGDVVGQRVDLSARHRNGEFAGILEIGNDVLDSGPPDDAHQIRFQTEKLYELEFGRWATRAVNDAVRARRLERQGVPPSVIAEIHVPVPLQVRGPTLRDPVTGAISETPGSNQMAIFVFPTIVVVSILVLVMFSTMPALQSVVEEKQQRIAEVLVGCLTPFELMLGKLCGIVAISLTTFSLYAAAGAWAAERFGVAQQLGAALIAWYVVFVVLAAFLFGSFALAVGAAANDLKEAQAMQMPATLVLVTPVMLIQAMTRNPSGALTMIGSFVPLSAPIMMPARLAMPTPVPWWHPFVAAVLVGATAAACVWMAARIFRIGLLATGRAVTFRDLLRWIRDAR
jgi:ABC-2 type transport system permease protein